MYASPDRDGQGYEIGHGERKVRYIALWAVAQRRSAQRRSLGGRSDSGYGARCACMGTGPRETMNHVGL